MIKCLFIILAICSLVNSTAPKFEFFIGDPKGIPKSLIFDLVPKADNSDSTITLYRLNYKLNCTAAYFEKEGDRLLFYNRRKSDKPII